MHAIISILDEIHFTRVLELWDELERACGLSGIKITPIPHFSWQVAEAFDFSALRPVVETLAGEIPPFKVRTTGLGLFSGPRPVLFLPVIRDARLSAIHARVWYESINLAPGKSPYYDPKIWMPHITLGFGDLTAENLPCVMDLLLNRSFDWEIEVDNLSVVVQQAGQVGELLYRLPLSGKYEPHAV